MVNNEALHLIVKYGNQMARGLDTIDEHRRVLKKEGAVWFGKLGRGIKLSTIAIIKKQVYLGRPAYLFLFQRSVATNIHRCRIVSIEHRKPAAEDEMIPQYYYDYELEGRMGLWVKIASLVKCTSKGLDNYHTASSGNKAMQSALRSMAGVFVISDGASTNVS